MSRSSFGKVPQPQLGPTSAPKTSPMTPAPMAPQRPMGAPTAPTPSMFRRAPNARYTPSIRS